MLSPPQKSHNIFPPGHFHADKKGVKKTSEDVKEREEKKIVLSTSLLC